jgi:hypothetical protein
MDKQELKMTIEVQQISRIRVKNGDKVIDCYCENDIGLGLLHDALMLQKGWVVDRMTKIHQDEVTTSEMIKQKSNPEAGTEAAVEG